MSVLFQADYETGKNVAVTVRQRLATGGEGEWWNEASGAWQSSEPSEADKRIALTDVDSDGVYLGGKTALATYSGVATVRYFDTAISTPLATDTIELVGGSEVTNADFQLDTLYQRLRSGGDLSTQIATAAAGGDPLNISPDIISAGRTWIVPADSVSARNKVVVVAGTTATFAVDFRRAINPGTGIQSAVSAVDDGGTVTLGNLTLQQERKQLHFENTSSLAAGEYTITAKVTTTDGDTIGAKCKLKVV